jgi:hypothetical protein
MHGEAKKPDSQWTFTLHAEDSPISITTTPPKTQISRKDGNNNTYRELPHRETLSGWMDKELPHRCIIWKIYPHRRRRRRGCVLYWGVTHRHPITCSTSPSDPAGNALGHTHSGIQVLLWLVDSRTSLWLLITQAGSPQCGPALAQVVAA